MGVQTKTYLKARFEAGDIPTEQDFIDLIDTFVDQPKTETLVDGASITIDQESNSSAFYALDTAQTSIALDIDNLVDFSIGVVFIRKQDAGDLTLNLSGTLLKFVNLDDKAAPNASLQIVISGAANSIWELNFIDTALLDGGTDRIVNVVAK